MRRNKIMNEKRIQLKKGKKKKDKKKVKKV